jgi:hypothetical protein
MRYIILVLLNLPVIVIALVNIITQFKMKHISKRRFVRQLVLWLGILTVLVGSFPVYNLLAGKQALDSSELSSFDIVQTTLLVLLIYIANYQRLKLERTDRMVRDLHQELSIRLSTDGAPKK